MKKLKQRYNNINNKGEIVNESTPIRILIKGRNVCRTTQACVAFNEQINELYEYDE